MRGTAWNDRDNSLVAQAELFDAYDRYDDGCRNGLRNLLTNCATSIAVDVPHAVTVIALEAPPRTSKTGQASSRRS